MAGLVQAGYLASSLLCIGSLSGLASQATARQGNILGILGVSSGILSSLAAVGFAPAVLAQFGGVAMIGSIVGKFVQHGPKMRVSSVLTYLGLMIGRRTTATDLPQTVAALHSVVGLAAVLTSIGSVMAHIGDISTLHLVSGYLGVLIGICYSQISLYMLTEQVVLPSPVPLWHS